LYRALYQHLFGFCARSSETSLTNADLIGKKVTLLAKGEDLVIVNPWYFGISFDRYYFGSAPWTTIPAVKDHKIHRYDTIKQYVMSPSPTEATSDVVERIANTLKAGKKVYFVGILDNVEPGYAPPILFTAPSGSTGWSLEPYDTAWSIFVRIF
jgi:hypothetical protein